MRTRLLGLISCLFASMKDNVANIVELQDQLAAEENRRRIAENMQRVVKDKQRVAEGSLDIVTCHTTLSEYLDLHQRLCATQLTFDPECPRNTRGGVTNPQDRVTPTIRTPWVEFGNLQTETYQH